MNTDVLQLEFFHVSNAGSLEEFMGRLREATKIKTTVRIEDGHGYVAFLAHQIRGLKKQQDKLLQSVYGAGRLWRRLLIFRCERLAKRIDKTETEAKAFAVAQLRAALRAKDKIAMERPDRTFRLARETELRRLEGEISEAVDVWVFAFPSSELFANNHPSVVAVM